MPEEPTPTTIEVANAAAANASPTDLANAAASGSGGMVEPFVKTFQNMYESAVAALPNIIQALVLFAVGLLVARFVRKMLSTALPKIGFDKIMERIGVSALFAQMGMRAPFSQILAKVAFWGILLFIVNAAADALQIKAISDPLNSAMAFLPKVITALIIAMVGYLCADLARGAALRAAERVGLDYASGLSSLLFGFLMVLVATLSLRQLGIETALIDHSVEILLGCAGLALAIAIGLGMRPLAQNIVSGVYARDLFPPGTEIEISGEKAKIVAVGPATARLVTKDGAEIVMPNANLVSDVVRCSRPKKN
ncbi:MAG: mechanosensitive ion channel [Verrucomicrobiales bacterium]